MKKKKRAAAKRQPNQYVACNFGGQNLAEPGCLMTNEFVERGWWAHDTAEELQLAMRSYKRAIDPATDSNGRRKALENAKDHFLCFGLLINESDLADSLRLVADALEGKLRGAKNDERILKAYFEAVQTGKRSAERSKNSPPLFSEVYDALTSLSGTSPVATKRKGTTPLTPEEKQTIRDFEWSEYPHTVIEHEIGKCFKRTDSGDIVAINENGDARGRTPKLNKDALRCRLKILGCPLSEKPGRHPKSP